MKNISAFFLVLCMVLLLAVPSSAEINELAFESFTVQVPDDLIIFTKDNLTDDHPFAEYFNMDVIRAQFDADPTLYMDAYHPSLGFDLMAVAVPLDEAIDMTATSDAVINVMLLPLLLKSYQDLGITVLSSGIAHQTAATYVTVYFSYAGSYVFQYYTTVPDGDKFLGVTFKIALAGQEITEEMLPYLTDMAETAVFDAYKAS